MRFQAQAILTAIATSKGEYEGRAFDSCTFHLSVDLPEKSTGETMGNVTRPFKMGTSAEFEKWRHLKDKWPVSGVPVECIFEATAGADNSTKLALVAIKPLPTQSAKGV